MTPTSTAPDPSDDLVDLVDLGAVERMAEVWCSRLDPAVVSGADAADGVERLAVMIRRFEAAQLLLARRAEACNAYAARAHSAADWLATQNGSSKAQAERALDTARRLDDCPATTAAFTNGEISTDEAEAVSDAARADPRAEHRLLDAAKTRHDLRETRTAADQVRRAARSAEDEAARHTRLHRTRSLRIGQTPDGHVEIRGQFTPAAFAAAKPVIDAHLELRLDQARRDGTRDGWDAYRADAFLAAITTATPTPTTPTISAAAPSAASPAEPGPSGPASPDHDHTLTDTDPATDGRLFAPGVDLAPAHGLDPRVNWNLVVLVDGIALKRG
ncbi:MAG: hypothetical protein ACXWB2_20665 [Acidimicrobiales bacterium]